MATDDRGRGRPAGATGGSDVDELRELLVTAGLEVLERDGLALAARSLGYSRVFAHLRRVYGVSVARASVHERIWAGHDDFRRDVVAATIHHLPTDLLGGTRQERARDRIIELLAGGLSGPGLVGEVARWMAPGAFDAVTAIPSLRRVQAAKVIASPFNRPLTTESLQGSLRDRSDSVLSRLRHRLSILTTGIGLMPRPDVVLAPATAHEVIGVAAINTFVGGFLDVNAGIDAVRRPLAIRGVPTDDADPWTMLGLGMEAAFLALYAPSDGRPGGVPDIEPAPPPPPPRVEVGDQGRRRTRAELRELVVAAGVEVLLGQRLDLYPESLSYASVFAHVERTRGIRIYRSTVHRRIWANHEDYWLDVVQRAVGSDPDLDGDPLAGAVDGITPPGGEHAGDPRAVARDRIRLLLAAELAATIKSPAFLRRQAVKAALLVEPDSERTQALRGVLQDTERRRVTRYVTALADHLLPLGFEPRSELGVDSAEALGVVATLALTVASGAVFDQAAGVEAVARTYPLLRLDDPDRTDEWTVPAVVAWALFDALFQPTG